MQTHVDLVHKRWLEVSNIRSLVNPRGLDLCLSRRNRQCIGVSTDFLKWRQNENLFVGSAFEAILEPTGDGSDGASETRGHQFRWWRIWLGHQDRDVLAYCITLLKLFRQKFGKIFDLVQPKNGSGGVVKPTLSIVVDDEINNCLPVYIVTIGKSDSNENKMIL